MSAEAGAGQWDYAGRSDGGRPVFRWQEPDGPARRAASPTASPTTEQEPSTPAAPRATTPLLRRVRARRGAVLAVCLTGLFITVVLLAFLAFGSDPPPDAGVVLVQAIFRHGDRTPRMTYPNDPYKEDTWPEGLGVLTNKGKLQMFRLGERLRARYDRLLGKIYSPSILSVISSASDRTLMSAEALLAGLWPPAPPQQWHPDLAWQPIPVHMIPRNMDDLIAAKRPCARYDAEYAAYMSSAEMKKVDDNNLMLYALLTEKTGTSVSNVTAVEDIYNILTVEKIHKLKLPEWTKGVFPAKMKPLFFLSQASFTQTDFMKRIKGGPLLREIVNHILAKGADTSKDESRMILYSGHDMTLVHVMRTLGFTEMIEHEYGATLVFELRWIEQGVRLEVQLLYYKNSETDSPAVLRIPGCSNPCEVGAFVKVVQNMLPTTWEAECRVSR